MIHQVQQNEKLMRFRTVLFVIGVFGRLTLIEAQEVVHVQAPAGLVGGLEFTAAQAVDGWANIPDMNDPDNAVTGTAVFVDDGTAADSLGCGGLVNGGEVSGNIAVSYRGSCAFDVKALNAQNAGATALVIINNNSGSPIGMGPGANGASITIPVIMITDVAGALLHNEIDSGNVVLYIGPECGVTGGVCHDLRTILGANAHVVGNEVLYSITVRNLATAQMEDISVAFDHPGIYTYQSASDVPTLVGSGHVEWQIDSLLPLAQRIITVRLQLPPEPALVGSSFTSTASVSTAEPDQDPSNDQFSLPHTILGSYDPNDMAVRTSSGLSDQYYFLAQDQWLEFTIRFQNTGTAPALSVYITDTLSPLLDVSTLELLGASHNCASFFPEPDIVQFEFIGMVLPDSVNNEPESHGFVSFRILPLPQLVVGDTIRNAADIYFDFNPPVHTNTTEVACEGSVGLVHMQHSDELSVFPNPASGQVSVRVGTELNNAVLRMLDLTGREIRTLRISSELTTIPVDAEPAGLYFIELLEGGSQRRVSSLVINH